MCSKNLASNHTERGLGSSVPRGKRMPTLEKAQLSPGTRERMVIVERVIIHILGTMVHLVITAALGSG